MKAIGVYKIESSIKPERCYIGGSGWISERWRWHIKDLRKNKHHSKKLQDHFNIYGEQDLLFSVLINCEKKSLLENEQTFLDEYNPFFNTHKKAGSPLGSKLSEAAKRKISAFQKGNKNRLGHSPSEETRQKIREKAKLRIVSEETRKKHSRFLIGKPSRNKGKKASEETKNKIREKMLGRYVSEETKAKHSRVHKGKKVSTQTREKLKLANLGKTHSYETKLKMSKSRIGKKQSKETIQKRVESVRNFYLKKISL